MATTAQNIVDRALRLLGVTGAGLSPSTDEAANGLTALNSLIESIQLDKNQMYALVDTAFTLVAATSSYTVGPAGNFALTPRPEKIEQCFVRQSNQDYPVDLIDSSQWFAIVDKTSTSDIPIKAYYETSMPTGTLLLWPIPNAANSLHIITWTTLQTFATLATSVTFAPGVERMLSYNLAIEVAPEFERSASPEVIRIAGQAMAAFKRANHRSILSHSAMGSVFATRKSNIIADSAR